MTAQERLRNYGFSPEKLKFLMDNGFMTEKEEVTDKTAKRLGEICDLLDMGLSAAEVKDFQALEGSNQSAAQVQLLQKHRRALLDEIHKEQRTLDRIDYLIYEIKQKGA